jgi:hypothetical protein
MLSLNLASYDWHIRCDDSDVDDVDDDDDKQHKVFADASRLSSSHRLVPGPHIDASTTTKTTTMSATTSVAPNDDKRGSRRALVSFSFFLTFIYN